MSKGEDTRTAILERAASLASRIGLQALSIASLAKDLEMSKSGLFAHFGSKETLQVRTLEHTALRFRDDVVRPAFQEPAGEPRVRALFENWLAWASANTMEGCLFIQSSTEFDDQPGPVRDTMLRWQRVWLDGLAESARRAIAVGHFRDDLDPDHFAFEFYALLLGYHNSQQMLRDPRSEAFLRSSMDGLLSRCRS